MDIDCAGGLVCMDCAHAAAANKIHAAAENIRITGLVIFMAG